MSECTQFDVRLAEASGDGEIVGNLSVTHGFTHAGARDGSVIFTINSSPLSAAVHTTEESLIAFAVKVLKELSP